MHPVINLVSTRCTEGNHALLQRWYADHVQLLLSSPQLCSAQLHRCVQGLHGHEPDYVCLYEFANSGDFERFESSPEKAQATVLTNAAPGRGAIEIVQRIQFERLLHQQFGQAPMVSPQGFLIQLQATDTWCQSNIRWLSDIVQEVRAVLPLQNVQLMGGLQETKLLQLHLGFGNCEVQPAWALLMTLLQQTSRYGHAPDQWEMQWASATAPVMQWIR